MAITIKLKDDSKLTLPQGSTAIKAAEKISKSMFKRSVLAKVNGKVQDLSDQLNDGDSLVLLDVNSPEAKETIGHSCEHILALAVVNLYPKAQVTMGPKDHSEGFYYDFDIGRAFNEEDLKSIENRMKEYIKDKLIFEKRIIHKDEARELFKNLAQRFKPEILDWIQGDSVSIYQTGNFIDLCRGPHLPHAGFIGAFKLTGASSCYWRADANNAVLQRISGVAFANRDELKRYLFRIEEAKKRDHRKLGPKANLFFVSQRFASVKNEDIKDPEAFIFIKLAHEKKDQELKNIVAMAQELTDKLAKLLGISKIKISRLNSQSVDAGDLKVDYRLLSPSNLSGKRGDAIRLAHDFASEHDININFSFDDHSQEDLGPGLVSWLPDGGLLRTIIEDFSRKRHFKAGYGMVYSPHIARSDLWRISGHLGFYSDNMFSPMNIDGHEYMLKPMNCPFHVLMFKNGLKSYRDLPLRLAEFGTVYRYEMAGVLHGLMRVRGFTQDDAHIFCRWDQLDEELFNVLEFIVSMLKAFGFDDFEMNLSTRPQKFVGKKKQWDQAETSLKNTLKKAGFDYITDEGGGAFYGPKIDVKLKDCLDRTWQCSTVQLDFNNPERFDISYINSSGEKERPVMLHRALFGSIERFIGILIEHYAGAFPLWLSAKQARVISVSDRHNEHCFKVANYLQEKDFRVEFTPSSDKLGAKIRKAQMDKIPCMLIIGDKEVQQNGASLRLRSQEDLGFFALNDLANKMAELCADYSNSKK